MTIESIDLLLRNKEIDKLKSEIEATSIVSKVSEALKQYNVKTHDVYDTSKRRDKVINDEDGRAEDIVKVARLPLPLQKKIVLTAAAFIGVPEISYNAKNQKRKDLVTIIKKVLEDNKFDYRFNSCVKFTKSEKQSAILIYTQKADKEYWEGFPISGATYKLRFKVLSLSKGDHLYPVYDSYGDMIAFGRYYEEGSDISHLDVYTADKIYYATKKETWEVAEFPNEIKKIPVIYFSQPMTDWEEVQPLIDRLEVKSSNHADTNDYYDSPIVKAKGNVEGFSKKGESGKVLQMDEGADAEYMTYDNLPESMKMEMDNLKEWIHAFTHTPDISFENLKNLGYFSTVALKVMFMDAHLKAYDSEEIFGEGVQRLYNYLKAAIAVIAPEFKDSVTVQLKPEFNYFIPQNVNDEVDVLIKAFEAGMISKRSMIEQSPLVQDVENELKQIEEETVKVAE